jgi:hypothetical protein
MKTLKFSTAAVAMGLMLLATSYVRAADDGESVYEHGRFHASVPQPEIDAVEILYEFEQIGGRVESCQS